MTGWLPRGVNWDDRAAGYLRKRPDRPFAFFLAGWSALMSNDAARAGRYFNGAVGLDGGYAPAYIGLVCSELRNGRFNRARDSLIKHSKKMNLSAQVNLRRFCCMAGICVITHIKDGNGGAFFNDALSGLLFITSEITGRGSRAKRRSNSEGPVAHCLKLIRYAELLVRDKNNEERAALANTIYALPGLPDELRLTIVSEIADRPKIIDYMFDNPVIFPKLLLNNIFREKIFSGDLREPKIILSNLHRDAASERIDNVNKWLFIYFCRTARRGAAKVSCKTGAPGMDIAFRTADELRRDGWWADPVVRGYIGGEPRQTLD